MASKRFHESASQSNLKDPEVIEVISSLAKDKTLNNYLDTVFNKKNFIDAATCLTRNGYKLYRISKPCQMSKNDMVLLFKNLMICILVKIIKVLRA